MNLIIMKTKLLLFSLSVLILYACSSSENTVKQEQKKAPEVYVFDDVSKIDSTKSEVPQQPQAPKEIKQPEPVKTNVQSFIIQVGAFTSKERAEAFVKENQSKIQQKMEISFSSQVQLYVVQLPSVSAREEAEKLRNELWKTPSFKDAFIITVDKQK